MVTIRKPPFLCLIDGMPLGADINATRPTNLAARLEHARHIFMIAIDHGDNGCPSVRVTRNRCGGRRHLRGHSDLIGLPSATGQRQIGLFAVLDVELKSICSSLSDSLVHPMDGRLRRHMIFAPNAGRHRPRLSVDGDNAELITARALHRGEVEAEDVASLVGALDVDRRVTLQALHAGSIVPLADLAHVRKSRARDQGDTLAGAESFGVTKFDLGRPDSAGDVDPVVVGGPFQGFAGIDRTIHLLLLFAVVVSRLLSVLTFHPLPLALLFGLLLV
jgi:hypothetical protein